ncbi:hypothetical protein ACFY00_00380 [Kitasatospora sp. NPDC001540]|uniref:hypothetical protein n=1 Tax=Kitasatospora sp. NPDC001540 TaxID=3364014 RepID=UPI0036771384
MTDSVRASVLFDMLREALERYGDEHDLFMLRIPEGRDPDDLPEDLPPGLADLLEASDGLPLTGNTRLYGADSLPYQQVNDILVGATMPDGSKLADASDFFCFGQAAENPLLVKRSDGSVWRVPDDGVVWYTGCRLERIADSLNDFAVEWLATERFLDLLGPNLVGAADTDWYRLLKLSGLVP